MPLVLAIEPDPRQAATLKRVVRAGVRAKLVVVDSKDAALAAIGSCVPDLILVTALLAPRDEDDLTRHLKTLDHAGHLQTLTIPLFAAVTADEKLGSRVFGGLRRKKRAPAAIDGCDPKVFGEQIEAYLQRATELREEQRALDTVAAAQPPAEQEFSPAFTAPAEQSGDPAFTAPAEQDFTPAAPIAEQGVEPALTDLLEEVTPVVAAAAEAPDVSVEAPSLEEDSSPAAPIDFTPAAPIMEQGLSDAFAVRPATASPEPETDEGDDAEWQVVPLEDQAADVSTGADVAQADPIPEQAEQTIEQAVSPGIEADREAAPSLMREASDVVHTAFAHALGNLHAFVARVGSGLKSGREPLATTEANQPDVTPPAATVEQQATDTAVADRPALSEPCTVAARDADEDHASYEGDEPLREGAPATEEERAADRGDWRTADNANHPRAIESDSVPSEEVETVRDARKKRRRRLHARRPLPDLEMALAGVDSRWLASAIAALRVDIQQLRQETRTVAAATPIDQPADVHAADGGGARSHNGNGSGNNGNGKSGNGNGHRQAEAPKRESGPIQDEWGFYNPERCGMQALMARLEESDAAPGSEASADAAPSPAVANQAADPAQDASAEPNWQDFSDADLAAEIARTSSALAPQPGSDLNRLAPLAMWARADEQMEYRVEDILPEASGPASKPRAELRLPDEVAAVRYASGCRIRRVRVAAAPKGQGKDDKRVLILSKKALEDLR